jgi:AcrR family transcriptional regulator
VNERPYHHGNLRTALLAQAERTVRERGVQDLSLRELARDIGVSHGAPRRHFADRQARLEATAAAYIRFATRDAALLELMFAGKRREQSGTLHEAAERAFSIMFELIGQGQADGVIEPGQPERVGLVLFATIQGIAALVTGGMIDAEQLDELVADAIAHFLRGSRTAV